MSRFTGETVKRWVADIVDTLGRERRNIDELNVFPVADADTGTNMYFTVRAGAGAVRDLAADAPVGHLLDAFAVGAMRGARGNSGLILGVALQGFARAFRADAAPADGESDGGPGADAAAIAEALESANARAWESVTEPVNGTMLTVLSEAARAASGAATEDGTAAVLACCVDAARTALNATEVQLGVLTRAHVVDAGGVGVLRLLEALARSLDAPVPPGSVRFSRAVTDTETEYGYEIIGELGAADTSRLTADLVRLGGTSMVVADGGERAATVHVHVPDRDAARGGVEAINRYGTIRRVRVSSLVAGRGAAADKDPGLIAVSNGSGLTATFALAGAEVLPSGKDPTSMVRQMRETIESLGARDVVVLPNSPITLAVALDIQARNTIIDGQIRVIPSRSDVQSLAAAAVFDDTAPLDTVTAAMTDAAEATRHGEVLVATTAGCNAVVGSWQAGDVLGRIDATVRMRGRRVEEIAGAVLAELAGRGAELVTFVRGEACPDGLVAALADRQGPDVEITVLDGSSDSALQIGVE